MLSLIRTCTGYVFNILATGYVSSLLDCYNLITLSLLHDNLPYYLQSQSDMWYYSRVATNQITAMYVKVVCIQRVPHWGANQEFSINRGNKVPVYIWTGILVASYRCGVLLMYVLASD